jgi:uncharacterized protein DUF3574
MWFKLLLIAVVFCSCASNRMIETDLYFGQSKPDGSMISEQEWKNFRETHIARVFGEGSTILSATGNWFDPVSHKLITEPTYVVICFYKKSASRSNQIDSLRYRYKTLFQQQSVLRVDKKIRTAF